MSALDFITSDPAVPAFQSAVNFQDEQTEKRNKRAVDQAIRTGIGNMTTPNGGPGNLPAPANDMGPQPPATPAAAPVAPPAPKIRDAADPLLDDSQLTEYAAPPAAPPSNISAVQRQTALLESGNQPGAVNSQGYSGLYQMGKKAMLSAGVYQPAPNENMEDNTNWQGTINVPGAGGMTRAQWLQNPQAQGLTFQAHMANLDREITSRGLDKYIGQTVNGVPITQDTLRSMMHGGGPAGVQKFLESRGTYNPADSNGTNLASFGNRMASTPTGAPPGVAPPQSQAAPPPTQAPYTPPAAATAYQPSGGGSRYDSILQELAKVPGGGTAALGLLTQQNHYDQQQYQQQQGYLRLANAAAMRGDTATSQYYQGLAGVSGAPPPTAPRVDALGVHNVPTSQGIFQSKPNGTATPLLAPDGTTLQPPSPARAPAAVRTPAQVQTMNAKIALYEQLGNDHQTAVGLVLNPNTMTPAVLAKLDARIELQANDASKAPIEWIGHPELKAAWIAQTKAAVRESANTTGYNAPAAVPPPPPAPPPAPANDPLASARAAISQGANRAAVIQRLRDNGIDPGGL